METKIINIVQNECVMGEIITSKTVISDLSLDSLSFISIIVELEKTFNIEFDVEILDKNNWNTVGDIIEYVKKVML